MESLSSPLSEFVYIFQIWVASKELVQFQKWGLFYKFAGIILNCACGFVEEAPFMELHQFF